MVTICKVFAETVPDFLTQNYYYYTNLWKNYQNFEIPWSFSEIPDFLAPHSDSEIEKGGHFLKLWPNDLKLSGIVVGISTTQNQKEKIFWNVAVPVHGTSKFQKMDISSNPYNSPTPQPNKKMFSVYKKYFNDLYFDI